MPTPLNPYDLQLLRNQAAITRKILKQYEAGIQTLVPTISTIKYKGKPFALKDYPALQTKVDNLVKKMHGQVYATTVNGIKESWNLSNKKNDLLVDKRVAGKRLKPKARQVLYDPNAGALKAFIDRKEKGLNLSDRVWNSLNPYKKELEQGLGIGIGKGQPAKEMAKDLKKYLRDPDSLFRRVRGEDGKLHLSAAARSYRPGPGVYRSSFKNSMRLTRTETNMSYRTSDHDRWNKLPFVTGIRIRLSNAHPKYDICDQLIGLYPKDFKFAGWHPQCICFATPEMLSEEEYDKLESHILNGRPVNVPSSAFTQKPPAAFGKYLKENKDRLARLSNEPYWMRDNKKYLVNQEPSPPAKKEGTKPAGEKISSQFTKIDSKIQNKALSALHSIDKVHGDGTLDDIPFESWKGTVPKGTQAGFWRMRDGTPEKITLAKKSKNPELSIVHEVGHFLDLSAIGKYGTFDSLNSSSFVSGVLKAAEKTDAIKTLRKLLKDGTFVQDGKTLPISFGFRNHVEYLLRPEEIWARSYAQFVAKRSGSESMQKGVDYLVDMVKDLPHRYQWDGNDFDVLEEAIEDMMVDLGWISR